MPAADGIKVIRPEDPGYPRLLSEIGDPPKELFYEGDINLLNSRCFAVVGSRKCSLAGAKSSELIGKRLAKAGITVVSGLASGIDAAAHSGALASGGKTIAVLGNGTDICYPKINADIQKKIAANGLLISEYPPGTLAKSYFFPRRNRIISGISEATIVVEAALRSGSLITAEAAIEQGREVFAVPGMISMTGSLGCNHLLADGAMPIFDINQFMNDIGCRESKGDLIPETDGRDLSPDEKKIINVVNDMGEPTIGEISHETGIAAPDITGMISILEIKGYLGTELGKVFISPSRL